jgi:hypothetical protein
VTRVVEGGLEADGVVVKGSVRCVELCTSRQSVYHRCELSPDIAGCGEVGQGRGNALLIIYMDLCVEGLMMTR